jgi:hypothetical protein
LPGIGKIQLKRRDEVGGRQEFFAFAEPAESESGRASVPSGKSEVTGQGIKF